MKKIIWKPCRANEYLWYLETYTDGKCVSRIITTGDNLYQEICAQLTEKPGKINLLDGRVEE